MLKTVKNMIWRENKRKDIKKILKIKMIKKCAELF